MADISFRPCKFVLMFWLIAAACAGVPAGVAASALLADMGWSPLLVFVVTMFCSSVLFALYLTLYFFSIRYDLDDRYVAKSSGVLWKKRRSIPLEKITNVDVCQGPLERMLGFGQVWIFTPSTGGLAPEEKLIGVPSPHEMKETIAERTEAAKSGGTPVVTAAAPDESVEILKEIRDSLGRIEQALADRGDPRGPADP